MDLLLALSPAFMIGEFSWKLIFCSGLWLPLTATQKTSVFFYCKGGGYQLTPLYNVISAFPLPTKKKLEPQKLKRAMPLTDKRNITSKFTFCPTLAHYNEEMSISN